MTAIPFHQSRYIMCSSFLFLFPALYAAINGQHWHAGLLALTSAVSANYWRHAIPGPRKTMDLAVAKVSVVVFSATGIAHLPIDWHAAMGLAGIPVFYGLSCYKTCPQNNVWVIYHVIFHIHMTYFLFHILAAHQRTQMA